MTSFNRCCFSCHSDLSSSKCLFCSPMSSRSRVNNPPGTTNKIFPLTCLPDLLEAFIHIIDITNQNCICYDRHINTDRQSVGTNADLAVFSASRDSSEESACLQIVVIPVKRVVEVNVSVTITGGLLC